jgi:hypothetical protein
MMEDAMKGFTLGLLCGAGAVTLLGAGLALAQAPVIPALSGNIGGLNDGRFFRVFCTNSQGNVDTSKRLTVFREQGNPNTPAASLQCQ